VANFDQAVFFGADSLDEAKLLKCELEVDVFKCLRSWCFSGL
jgi:hypothetical protein